MITHASDIISSILTSMVDYFLSSQAKFSYVQKVLFSLWSACTGCFLLASKIGHYIPPNLIYIYINIYGKKYIYNYFLNVGSIFINPSARAGYDTRSIFKQSLTGLNSEFSFSLTSCLTKAEEPSLPYYLPIAGGINKIHTFPKAISAM